MVNAIILAFDAVFVLLVLLFGVCSTRSALTGTPAESPVGHAPVPSAPPRLAQPAGLLVDVLVRMGFKAREAERAAHEIGACGNEPLDVQVRKALGVLCHGAERAGR